MAAGDVKVAYRPSVALSVTNLHSQPTSTDNRTGWTSGEVVNTTNLDLDHLIAAQFTVAAASLTAGEIRVYVLPMLDDTTWPDVYSTGVEGTQSASAVVHDTEQLNASFTLLWSATTDTNASRVYSMPQRSLFSALGFIPRKYILFVTHSTGQNLAASGNAVYVTGVYNNVATA